eukprot:COSAG06_NODE_9163_length_1970_cov_1.531267_3_plen_123_part_00
MAAPPLCAPVAAVLPGIHLLLPQHSGFARAACAVTEIHLPHACSCHLRPAQEAAAAAAAASPDLMQSSARVHAELRLHDWRELGFQVRPIYIEWLGVEWPWPQFTGAGGDDNGIAKIYIMKR